MLVLSTKWAASIISKCLLYMEVKACKSALLHTSRPHAQTVHGGKKTAKMNDCSHHGHEHRCSEDKRVQVHNRRRIQKRRGRGGCLRRRLFWSVCGGVLREVCGILRRTCGGGLRRVCGLLRGILRGILRRSGCGALWRVCGGFLCEVLLCRVLRRVCCGVLWRVCGGFLCEVRLCGVRVCG